ncbi:MAG: radical SAM-associated putative lipoprotein [Methylococcaceae bacterium]|nr:radical SAM-associated putative lipoprotein [Prolixibacteraceae bacterium]
MKNNQWRPIKVCSLLLLALITFLVIIPSCNQDEYFGRHTAKFRLKGTILSAKDELPLKDIVVIMLADTLGIDTSITDLTGNFEVIDPLGIPAEVAYKIRFTELEDTSNSSDEIIDSTIIYNFTDLKFTNGDGRWYSGETSGKLDVTLKPKNITATPSSN